jgi:hypothetical protein
LKAVRGEGFNEVTFNVIYYKAIFCDNLGGRSNYVEALRAFEFLLQKHASSQYF